MADVVFADKCETLAVLHFRSKVCVWGWERTRVNTKQEKAIVPGLTYYMLKSLVDGKIAAAAAAAAVLHKTLLLLIADALQETLLLLLLLLLTM